MKVGTFIPCAIEPLYSLPLDPFVSHDLSLFFSISSLGCERTSLTRYRGLSYTRSVEHTLDLFFRLTKTKVHTHKMRRERSEFEQPLYTRFVLAYSCTFVIHSPFILQGAWQFVYVSFCFLAVAPPVSF